MSIPRIVLGGVRSGEGKTTVALGLMAALRARGRRVQGFKVGPDYLDTGYQLLATGRPGRNLDLWMMGEPAVRASLATHGGSADIAVIEGVMGLFDGHRDGVTPTSTADVAKTLGAPVVLVIDAAHLAASAGAIALGYKAFDPEVTVAGVILNRWNPMRAKAAVEKAMARAGLPILGYLPPSPEVALPSRHLGLVIAEELRGELTGILARLAALVEAHVDLDAIERIAQSAPAITGSPVAEVITGGEGLRIAVARDDAFAFYYPENIELLEGAGAEIVYFSPLADTALPEADGLYLGGGYPELYGARVEANTGMRESIARAIAAGLPTYAECGGLLYLCETLTDVEGRAWPMAGAVPCHARMHPRLRRMGYREGVLQRDCLLGPAGDRLRGHEFHYSSCAPETTASPAYLLDNRLEGFARGNLFASYLHLHFAGCPQVVKHWLARCRQWKEDMQFALCNVHSLERANMNKAIIVIGHGSRSPEATAQFLQVVAEVRARQGGSLVLPAHMEFAEPTLKAAITEAVGAGATEIVVVPCFLYRGIHIKEDIPEMLAELSTTHPRVRVIFANPIGADPRIAEILSDRIEEALCPA